MKIIKLFAELLSYPTINYKKYCEMLTSSLEWESDKLELLADFNAYIEDTELPQVEELFTQTFDMNKTTCLEVGWHLYGEDYNRGKFLVNMRQSLAQFKISESGELPDHISHCLKLLIHLEEDDAVIFSREYIERAIKIIISGMPKENPYTGLLVALKEELAEIEVTDKKNIAV